eukprot:5757180-Pleurochrysis_carterae.AAC.1
MNPQGSKKRNPKSTTDSETPAGGAQIVWKLCENIRGHSRAHLARRRHQRMGSQTSHLPPD